MMIHLMKSVLMETKNLKHVILILVCEIQTT